MERLRTTSIWEPPSERFYRFLKKFEVKDLPKRLLILGCSDGNYVIPATKRGFNVFGIDVDDVALFGEKTMIAGIEVDVIGMAKRLELEGIDNNVTIVHDDCFSYNTTDVFAGVFTSGLIHYQRNFRYKTEEIMTKIQSYVSPGGLLLLEYIHRSEENNGPLRHFITASEAASFFDKNEWVITSNKKKKYVENPNPRNDHIHDITWGRLYVEKRLK